MSTKFTTKVITNDSPFPLTVLLGAASQSVLRRLHIRLRESGYEIVTEPHLVLFGNLDCGATHAAQIAQRMQVSRQAISKTLRELQSLALVRLEDDPARRNQKLVVMTEAGMQLALDAREQLHAIEAEIASEIGTEALTALRCALEAYWKSGPGHRQD
jgi:DNA-binding MarR family transcriptional regulator